MSGLPPFLRHPDPDHREAVARWRWYYPHLSAADRPLLLNPGTEFEEMFTMETAMVWAERLAADVLR